MKTFLLTLFLTIGLALPMLARLGDDETTVIAEHEHATIVTTEHFAERAYLIVFQTDTEEIGVMFLDGKCSSEVYTRLDDAKPSFEWLHNYMASYCADWAPAGSPHDGSIASQSADGKFFATYGLSEALKKNHVFSIFTREWRDFARELIRKENDTHL